MDNLKPLKTLNMVVFPVIKVYPHVKTLSKTTNINKNIKKKFFGGWHKVTVYL